MEEAPGSTSSLSAVVQNTASVSPIIFNDESPVLEPMNADAKALPTTYSECDFADLVELIGMYPPPNPISLLFYAIPVFSH